MFEGLLIEAIQGFLRDFSKLVSELTLTYHSNFIDGDSALGEKRLL
jgi:hypothetical protein